MESEIDFEIYFIEKMEVLLTDFLVSSERLGCKCISAE